MFNKFKSLIKVLFTKRRLKYYILLFIGLPKSIYFNLKYFGFSGIILPVVISPRVILKSTAGGITISCKKKHGLIKIGFHDVSISSKWDKSIWNVYGEITFNGSAIFGSGTKIFVNKKANLYFGDKFYITANSEIVCNDEIIFGSNCLLSWDILVMDTDAHPIKNLNGQTTNYDQPISIGSNIWIGCRTTILKGTRIKNNCVVAVGSLLHKTYKAQNALIGGNPAITLRKDIIWKGSNF